MNYFNVTPVLTSKKIAILCALASTGILINIGLLVKSVLSDRMKRHIIFFSIMCCLYLVNMVGLFYATCPQTKFDSLNVVNLPSIEYESIFSKKIMLEANINSFDEFHKFSRGRYELYKKFLMTKWAIEDEKKLKGIFYMNIVAAMWGYGNNGDSTKSSCILTKKSEYYEIPNKKMNVRTFIESEIGCCIDNVLILRYLLNKDDIQSRIISLPVHYMIEAQFADGWHTLDANSGLIFQGKWSDIQNRKHNKKIEVIIFPHNNLVYKDNPFYRKGLWEFQMFVLFSAIYKDSGPIKYVNMPNLAN